MWKFTKSFSIILCLSSVFAGVFISCRPSQKNDFTFDSLGYYFRLISFKTDTFVYQEEQIAWINVSFATQSDSVFWDSFNNLNNRFFIAIDSSVTSNFLKHSVSKASVSDSVCLLIKKKEFFKQQFKQSKIPFFCERDSVVKVNYKVNQILSKIQYENLKFDMAEQEKKQIKAYLEENSVHPVIPDSLGIYWLEKPSESDAQKLMVGDLISVSYKGYFLNGRLLETSPQQFDFIYGSPDQLIKGLNYVIRVLKEGQNAKIVLPSPLAFGAEGNSIQTIPAFTPLLYEIKIISVKKQNK